MKEEENTRAATPHPPRGSERWSADKMAQWLCPKCLAGYDAGAGLVCDGDAGNCREAVSTALHGTDFEPCEEARCMRCGWGGTLGNATPEAAPHDALSVALAELREARRLLGHVVQWSAVGRTVPLDLHFEIAAFLGERSDREQSEPNRSENGQG